MIAKNLATIRKTTMLAQNEFALKLGISPRAYINYERGERKPPYDVLIKLYEIYNVNLNWFITGKGEIFNPQQFDTAKDELRLEVLQILKDEGIIK